MFHWKNNSLQNWREIRGSKWWQKLHFWLNINLITLVHNDNSSGLDQFICFVNSVVCVPQIIQIQIRLFPSSWILTEEISFTQSITISCINSIFKLCFFHTSCFAQSLVRWSSSPLSPRTCFNASLRSASQRNSSRLWHPEWNISIPVGWQP